MVAQTIKHGAAVLNPEFAAGSRNGKHDLATVWQTTDVAVHGRNVTAAI